MEKTTTKKKERRIVTWTQQEDDILRNQISLHGTENWAIIASNFNDKSTRQCRRRWYTYLNSDFKRGGWSPEEDTLLCEAQRLFGNRWTEIAKVVSGRTDNAVKNRFTTLCKKRAKYEETIAKENKIGSCLNSNNKRMLFPDSVSTPPNVETESPLAKKLRRSHIPDHTKISNYGDRSHIKANSAQTKPPFSVLSHNVTSIDSLEKKEMFVKKDDSNVIALMQEAENLSSLAQKVNEDKTEQTMETAWKVLQDFLNKSQENDYLLPDIDFNVEECKDLVEDLINGNEDIPISWKQPDLHDSPASSEYSSGSNIIPPQTRTCNENVPKNTNEILPMTFEEELNSPVQVTPLFRSLAANIPSPQFSESERKFLRKTLGIESPSLCPNANPSQQPPCKRVLLDSL